MLASKMTRGNSCHLLPLKTLQDASGSSIRNINLMALLINTNPASWLRGFINDPVLITPKHPLRLSNPPRLALSLSQSSLMVCQLNINDTFLQGTLQDDVFMAQPPGFVYTKNPSHVYRLKKAIYGLKQAPRAWYIEHRNFLANVGFPTHSRRSHYSTPKDPMPCMSLSMWMISLSPALVILLCLHSFVNQVLSFLSKIWANYHTFLVLKYNLLLMVSFSVNESIVLKSLLASICSTSNLFTHLWMLILHSLLLQARLQITPPTTALLLEVSSILVSLMSHINIGNS